MSLFQHEHVMKAMGVYRTRRVNSSRPQSEGDLHPIVPVAYMIRFISITSKTEDRFTS
jgi:hypothetical protein